MSSKPISELNELTAPQSQDMLAIVNTFETKRVSVVNLLASEVGTRVGFTTLAALDSPYAVVGTDSQLIIDTTAGDVTVNLPVAASNAKLNLWIKNSGTGQVVVDGNAAETIDDDLTKTLAQYSCMHIMCDGTEWWIL